MNQTDAAPGTVPTEQIALTYDKVRTYLGRIERSAIDRIADDAGMRGDQLAAFMDGYNLPDPDETLPKLVRAAFPSMSYDPVSGQIVPQGTAVVGITLAGLRAKVREQIANVANLAKRFKIEDDLLVQFAYAGANLKDFQIAAITAHFHIGMTYRDGRFESTNRPLVIGAAALGCVVTKVPIYNSTPGTHTTLHAEPKQDQRERELDWLRGWAGPGGQREVSPAVVGTGDDIVKIEANAKKKQAA